MSYLNRTIATQGGKRQDFTALHESAKAKGLAVPGFEAQRQVELRARSKGLQRALGPRRDQ
jgi:hypothetical protein